MIIQLSKYSIYIGDDSLEQLKHFFNSKSYSSVFVLTDNNSKKQCYPNIENYLPEHSVITIKPGEENKQYETCNDIWMDLSAKYADRKTLLINLGGGVVCDIGGFAAGLYKRGIEFIHIPTTLLAQADACIGGKTGVDFFQYKNLIGLFNDPQAIFIYPSFLKTLPKRELISGYAEVIKHHLISDADGFKKLCTSDDLPQNWEEIIKHSIKIKSTITEKDPLESNERMALNFGHTIGHAIESSFLQDGVSRVLHGEAVAAGMICESAISQLKGMLEHDDLKRIIKYIKLFFELPVLDERKMDFIKNCVLIDKKNQYNKIRCTLLEGIGKYTFSEITVDDVLTSLRFYNSIIS